MSSRLSRENLKGIWAAAPLSWDESYELDEAAFRENLQRLMAAEPHGIYTFGSTGEFHALGYHEFCRIVDIFIEEVGPSDIPTQVGCHATATHQVIRMLKYAQDAGADGGQVALPFWMKLTEEEILKFWGDVSSAVPDLPLTCYNSSRTKWSLSGEQFADIVQAAPNLIGVKWAGEIEIDTFQEVIDLTPELAHFVGEPHLMDGMKIGSPGSYSSWVLWQPELTVKMFNLAEADEWEKAEEIATGMTEVTQFAITMCGELGLGMMDPVIDKGLMVVTGFLVGHQRTRPPYLGWPDDGLDDMRRRLKAKFPWFIPD